MYIYMNDCAVSIVQHQDSPTYLLIRSRSLEDISTFANKLDVAAKEIKIKHTPNLDYPYRMELLKVKVASMFYQQVLQIEYTNYKDSIEAPDRLFLMHEIHALTKVRQQK